MWEGRCASVKTLLGQQRANNRQLRGQVWYSRSKRRQLPQQFSIPTTMLLAHPPMPLTLPNLIFCEYHKTGEVDDEHAT